MKKIITILTFSLVTLTAGLAFAYDLFNVGTGDKLYGITSTAPMSQVSGAAAGGIREEKAIRDEDTTLSAHQDVLFDSYIIPTVVSDSTQGKAAGGVRGDADRGSRIFDGMLGARHEVLFDN